MNISASSLMRFTASAAMETAGASKGVMELGLQTQFIRKDLTLSPAEKDAQLSLLSRQAKQAVALAKGESEAAVHSTLVDSATKLADSARDRAASRLADPAEASASVDGNLPDPVKAAYMKDGTQGSGATTEGPSIGAVVDVQA